MATKTVLGELELPLAQCIDVEDAHGLVRHAVPALDGDFFQRTGRRAARVAVTGVVAGPEARDGLEQLRDRLRSAEPVDFVADVATATRVSRVLVERLDVRELAGRPDRFEYAFLLREFVPPPPAETEVPPTTPPAADPATGTLVVEVTVEGEPDFDMGRVTVTAEGTGPSGPTSRTLTQREGNRWTETSVAPGEHTVRAQVADPEMTGATAATVRAGQTTTAQITLVPSQAVARAFVVSFRFDSAFVEPCMRAALRRAAAFARAHPSQKLLVVGHTDKTGSDAYNQSLSERRARAVFACVSFQESPAAAVAEWTALRQPRGGDPVRTLQDRWGAREYQQMLQQLGFYPGQIDGNHGPGTDEAVRSFRCRKGLPPGTTVDDAVWEALIRDYLADDPPAVARAQLLPNCASTKLEWIGCGEQDPVNNTPNAHRPNRRVELLFTTAPALPCPVSIPDTWHLPAPPLTGAHTDAEWCVGEGADPAKRCCFGKREPPPEPPRWLIQPAEGGTVNAAGRILKEVERADGTLEQVPAANESFVLITAAGEFRAGEAPSGLPTPARAGADGSFSFPGKPKGLYALEIQRGVVARLLDAPDAPALGPTVCRSLLADADRFDVLILRDPALREIRLPVIAHLMTALEPTTRAARTCTDAAVSPPVAFEQKTERDEAAVRALLREANRIWGRARVRFELRDTLREAFATVGRTSCAVTEDERNTIIVDSATPNVVNLYFFANVEATGEAGVHVVGFLQDGAGNRVRPIEAIAIGDRVQLQLIQNFPPIQKVPTVPEQEVILAHELGHYLSLDHEEGSATAPQNRNRLMLPKEEADHRRLIDAEVTRARGSANAGKDCVPLSLRVTGATRYGGTGHRFVAIRDEAAAPVVVDAVLPPHLAASGLTMTGGDPGAGPAQRLVPRSGLGRREVIARFVPPAGGTALETYAAVQLVDFDVTVEGARRVGTGTTFIALRNATGRVTVIANVTPAPDVVPTDLATFSAGDETADPLRRTLPLSAAGSTTVDVTVAGVTKTVTIVVSELALNVTGATQTAPGQFAAGREDPGDVTIEAKFTPPVPDEPGIVEWEGGREGAGPRFRLVSRQAVGVTTVTANVGSPPAPQPAAAAPGVSAAGADGGGGSQSATITVFDFTLDVPGATRLGGPTGTQFVARPDTQPLTVVATITPPGVLPGVVTWTGAQELPGVQPPTATVRRTTGGTLTVSAEMGTITKTITIFVLDVRLEVTGATRISQGGSDFIAIVDAAANVQVEAVLTPAPNPVPPDLVAWTSSDNSATDDGPTRRQVPRTPKREVTVTATVAGQTESVRIFVSEFTLGVSGGGVAEIPPAGSNEFIVLSAAGQNATVTATLDPAPSPVPDGLVTFAGDPTTADTSTTRLIPLEPARAVRVEATVAGVTKTVRVNVVTFTLVVTDATELPAGSGTFFAGQQAGANVGIEARITPQPAAALPANFVAWTGSTVDGANPLRSTVSRASTGTTAVTATCALLGGATRSVTINVVSFTLTVRAPAVAIGPAGGGNFMALQDPAPLTAEVTLTPAPNPVPAGLVTWTGATPVAGNDLQATVVRTTAGPPVQVTATIAGIAQTATVHVVTFTLEVTDATAVPAAGTAFFALCGAGDVTVHARFTPTPAPALPTDLVTWTGGTAVAADPLARTVARAAPSTAPVAIQAQALGATRSVTVTVISFDITRAQGAFQIGPRSSTVFAATAGAGNVTLVGTLTPALNPVPAGLVTWAGATATADPLQATVSRGAAVRVTATATVLGTAFTRTVAILADPSTPGPFQVGEHEYDTGTMTVTVGLGTFTVRRKALVRYPADVAGVDQPVAAARPTYPLVFILHGNHRRFDDLGNFVESFRGHEPLARHLATHGYIAVSIDGDDINARPAAFGSLIPERGELIREHIGLMVGRNVGDPIFGGHIDTATIGLIGHSRGGEGVVAAQVQNVTGTLGLGIRAVISIAPTDFESFSLTGAPYLVLYGTSDGDVSGLPDGGPFILYDRAAAPKAMWFAYGACHNRFSTNADWNDAVHIDNDDARLLSQAQHQAIARGFCMAFMERHMRGDGPFDLFFAHDQRPASVAGVEIFPQYRDPTRLLVDDFEQPAANAAAPLPDQLADRAQRNTLARTVTGTGLALPGPMLPPAPTAFANALTESPLTRNRLEFFVHQGTGLLAAWTTTTGVYESDLGTLDASAFQALSFRVTQRNGSGRNTPGAAQDFFVALVDTSNRVAELRVGATATIPAPFVRHDHLALHPFVPPATRFVDARPDSPSLSKSALRTVRLRLDDFKAVTPQLDLAQLRTVRFAFRQTASGEVAVDDLEFSL